MSRQSDIRGETSTFATVLIWDEATFEYQRFLDCARHRDARAEFLALHQPPLVIVESIRFGGELQRP